MSLISRSTGIHNHLAPKKKHLSSYSATHAAQGSNMTDTSLDTPQRERPFAPLKFENESTPTGPTAYKSIFQL